jgi:membrane protease subunit HflC
MKNLAITILITLIVVAMGLYLVSFQVRQTETSLVTTFGKPTREITKPGWYFKWPTPIQRVHKFDSRTRVFEAKPVETTTKGAVPIIVNSYIVWRVSEPLQFFNAVGTIKEAENKLDSQINDTQNRIIGQHAFSEFVNSDPNKIKFDDIQAEMLTDIKQTARQNYGIEIKTIGIKQLKISEDVSKDVFERMKAERNRRTEATVAEGNAQATKIKTDAEAKRTELLAAAEARAKSIQGQGDAEAAKYYKMLEEDPQLAMFLRDMETLKKVLEERATIVIGTDSAPFIHLKQMPSLKPNEPNKP